MKFRPQDRRVEDRGGVLEPGPRRERSGEAFADRTALAVEVANRDSFGLSGRGPARDLPGSAGS